MGFRKIKEKYVHIEKFRVNMYIFGKSIFNYV